MRVEFLTEKPEKGTPSISIDPSVLEKFVGVAVGGLAITWINQPDNPKLHDSLLGQRLQGGPVERGDDKGRPLEEVRCSVEGPEIGVARGTGKKKRRYIAHEDLVQLRESLGMTCSAMCQALGLSQKTYRKAELGRPLLPETVEKLSRGLEELLGEEAAYVCKDRAPSRALPVAARVFDGRRLKKFLKDRDIALNALTKRCKSNWVTLKRAVDGKAVTAPVREKIKNFLEEETGVACTFSCSGFSSK